MATVSSVVSHFPTAKEGFTTTLASTISAGATTVPLNSTTGYASGDVVVLVIDPGNASKQVFTGTVSGTDIVNVVWTEGSNTSHTLGATVSDYVTATHQAMMQKGILRFAKQDGSLDGDAAAWQAGQGTWTYASATTFTVPAADAANISKGTKLKFTQTTVKYFIVANISGTTVTIISTTDYTLANAAITSPYYSNASTPPGFPATFNYDINPTGITVGNGTKAGNYFTVGNQILCRAVFTLGSTSSITGSVTFAQPCTVQATTSNSIVGDAQVIDASPAAEYFGNVEHNSTTAVIVYVDNTGGTYATAAALSGTVPITFTTGDSIVAIWRSRF